MAAPQETGRSKGTLDTRAAIVVPIDPTAEQAIRNKIFDDLPMLYGCPGVRYDEEGNILIRMHRAVPKKNFPLDRLRQVFPASGTSSILSERSQSETIREPVISMPEDVEKAMAMVWHIRAGIEDRERPQARAVVQRVEELSRRYRESSQRLTDQELAALEKETYNQLGGVGLNPATLRDEYKKSMTAGAIKASGRRDSKGRINPQATLLVLSGAHNAANKRLEALNRISVEFSRDYEALRAQRKSSRTLFKDIVKAIAPDGGMPASQLFCDPQTITNRKQQEMNVGRAMDRMIRDLQRLVFMNGYRRVGIEAAGKLEQIKQLVVDGKEKEVMEQGLFPQVHRLLTTELQKGLILASIVSGRL